MSPYEIELGVSGVGERMPLSAEDDNAARREALLTMGDLLRDHAIDGVYTAALDLTLFSDSGRLVYEVHVAAVQAEA